MEPANEPQQPIRHMKLQKFLSFVARTKILAFTAVIALVLAAGGWLAYRELHHPAKPVQTVYLTDKLVDYKFAGPFSGSGMSFKIPNELTEYSKSSGQVELLNQYTYSGVSHRLYISAASASSSQAITFNQLVTLNQVLMSPDNRIYPQYIAVINNFVKSRLPTGWQFKLEATQHFSNSSIQTGAWSFDMSTSDPTNKQEPIQGKVLYAVSGKNTYFFLISTTAYDWQPNQAVWQKIFDSLKVDQ